MKLIEKLTPEKRARVEKGRVIVNTIAPVCDAFYGGTAPDAVALALASLCFKEELDFEAVTSRARELWRKVIAP